jgi:hypothetical protein
LRSANSINTPIAVIPTPVASAHPIKINRSEILII